MTTEMHTLSPQLLGFWVRCIRTASKWSQEALAESSGLNLRTIQRIEAGQPASVTTRRSLARGLGYENPDVFDERLRPRLFDAESIAGLLSFAQRVAAIPNLLSMLPGGFARFGKGYGRIRP